MILIADSGSTKTDWCLVEQGVPPRQISTKGINPFFQSEEEISDEISRFLLPRIEAEVLDAVHFYGAGCVFPDQTDMMRRSIIRHLRVTGPVEVSTDMLAAARALCGHAPGIACILGTGSNSCYYDGERILDNVSPLGFILGDEGSGACMGKLLVGDILKNQTPPALKEKFLAQFSLTSADLIDRVYRQPFPNRFLASLSPFLAQNIDEPCLRSLVLDSFKSFLRRNVLQYDCRRRKVHLVGSIAFHYKELLAEAAQSTGIRLGTILRRPMERLITYHCPLSSPDREEEQPFPKTGSNDNPALHLPSLPGSGRGRGFNSLPLNLTECPSLYTDLEKKSVRQILDDINAEDRKVALAVQQTIPQLEKLVTQIVPRMRQGGRIFYLGAGTSGRLGVLDASEIPPTFGMPPTLVIGLIAGGDTALRNPVENAEDDLLRGWEELSQHQVTDKDTVIGIAASGTTPYVIGALREARLHGILTACITGNPGSPMAVEADVPIEVAVGPEYVTGSSRMKSGTAQKMILNMITTSVMIRLGRVKGNKMVHMQLSNRKLVVRGTRMLMDELGLDYDKARTLLLAHGSVKAASDAYRAGE